MGLGPGLNPRALCRQRGERLQVHCNHEGRTPPRRWQLPGQVLYLGVPRRRLRSHANSSGPPRSLCAEVLLLLGRPPAGHLLERPPVRRLATLRASRGRGGGPSRRRNLRGVHGISGPQRPLWLGLGLRVYWRLWLPHYGVLGCACPHLAHGQGGVAEAVGGALEGHHVPRICRFQKYLK